MWFSTKSLFVACCEAATGNNWSNTASCPSSQRIASTTQLLKLFLLISRFFRKNKRILIHQMNRLCRITFFSIRVEQICITKFNKRRGFFMFLLNKSKHHLSQSWLIQIPVKGWPYIHECQSITSCEPFYLTHCFQSSSAVLFEPNFPKDQKYSAPYSDVLYTHSRITALFRLGQFPELNSLSHFDF